ncbi:EF-hand domain-containing protein [Paraburkholderia lycopersici]|uniref:EF-hand domain pair n=1 Tax=Paraburkholderia lycopersici TaxID=416944 RepID=A0A1G7D000_9BURK|nr:EF-hand domain-containing protein [Paraburkholderia lycopersici]SDE44360.1 EF-hand domain pair [Paraburkholderia lycopersici]
MAISSVGSDTTQYTQTGTTQQRGLATASTTAPPAGASSANPSVSAGSDMSTASSVVNLSAGAQVIADANAQGIGFGSGTFTIPPGMTDPGEIAKAVAAQVRQENHRPFDQNKHRYVGAISESDFENEIGNLGGSQSSAATLFGDLDSNGDGSVSDSELYTALGNTKSDTDSATSQALMQLMDTNNDGSVSMTEFSNVEMGLTNAEKPTTDN